MIRELRFENFLCFRGEHIIPLRPTAYSINARYEIDAGRSNMGGKSAITEAIDFAMTGRTAKFRKLTADGWITDGEKQGSVTITLEDGSAMNRSRRRGSATQIAFTSGSIRKGGEEAEKAFREHIGFGVADTNTIAYFEQDAMNRIVRTESEKRFDIIRGWLGLQLGERAEDAASEIVKKLVREQTKLKQKRVSVMDLLPKEEESGFSQDHYESEVINLSKEIHDERKRLQSVEAHEEDLALLEKYDTIVEQGTKLAEEVKEIAEDLTERGKTAADYVAEQQSAYLQAQDVVRTKRKVSLGQFDGKCPVADIQCPATKRINGDREASESLLRDAMKKEERAAKTWQVAKTGAASVLEESNEANYKRAKLEELRERGRGMLDAVKDARKRIKMRKAEGFVHDQTDDIEAHLRELQEDLPIAQRELAQYVERKKQRLHLQKQLESVEQEYAENVKLVATATAARAIFRATQRRVAERALETIGEDANAMLRSHAVDLSIDIQWEREGNTLAKTCEMCGAAFPTSAKVKRCEVCDAERGQNIVQSLEFILSDRSGAADDFAGIALQIAAGSYLLRLRNSSWATASIDEPFAKMDRTIRREAAKRLLQLLGGGVYRQLLVISHSPDTTDLYPARINILVHRDGSRTIETT
jgi:hypothetical protein